ncbi:MAG: alpha/beta hydrolase [Blastocatellia bacterium]|nr:alpha/beta hydrolase [Blastocatellia bacterium]
MKFASYLLITIVLLVLASPSFAQKLPAPILLWPNGAPGATGTSDEDKPAVIPFVPAESKRTGAAILVIPGGGFTIRATDHEGVLVSQWLRSQGITAFLLRYRLRPLYTRNEWLKDGQRAMQYIRAHAAEYHIAPHRVGAVGFSAGAQLAADLSFNALPGQAEAQDPMDHFSTRPDFQILAYGSMQMPTTLDQATIAKLPPAFLYGTVEDAGSMGGLLNLYTSLYRAKVPVEAHFFRNGEHGSGFAIGDPVLGEWPKLMHTWLTVSGFLTDKPRYQLPGIVKLGGSPLLRGMLVLTPVDNPGAPPVIAYITNAHTRALGSFIVPQNQGPVAGKYRVEVRQEATRWTSNSRDPFMLKVMEKQRNNALTDADRKEWGEYLRKRDLSPSIENQRVFSRQRPKDKKDYIIEIKDGSEIVLEVFSR